LNLTVTGTWLPTGTYTDTGAEHDVTLPLGGQ